MAVNLPKIADTPNLSLYCNSTKQNNNVTMTFPVNLSLQSFRTAALSMVTSGPTLLTHSLFPPCSILAGRKNSAALRLPRDHAWPTYLPLSQSMPGNSVVNSNGVSYAN